VLNAVGDVCDFLHFGANGFELGDGLIEHCGKVINELPHRAGECDGDSAQPRDERQYDDG